MPKQRLLCQIILFLSMVLGGPAAGQEFANDKKNPLIDLALQEQHVQAFDLLFYRSLTLEAAAFQQGLAAQKALIDRYLVLERQFPQQGYAHKAFYGLEKMKAWQLFQIFRPIVYADSLRGRRNQALVRQQQLVHSVINLDLKLKLARHDGSDTVRSQLHELRRSLAALKDSVRKFDPEFYNFFLLQSPLELSMLQEDCLDEKEILLDFYIQEDRLTVFCVSRDSFHVVQWPCSSSVVKNQMMALLAVFYDRPNLLDLEFDNHLAHALYRQLFLPLESITHHHQIILIIPDDFLCGFPFELLVADTSLYKPSNGNQLYQQFQRQQFLVHKYAFCYNYSTAALSPEFEQFRFDRKIGHRLLMLSEPIVTSSSNYSSNEVDELYFQLYISNYVSDEVKRVARLLWRHTILKRERATKTNLMQQGGAYRYLYLAVPGIINNGTPINSALLFTQEYPDSMVPSCWLTPSEVLKAHFSADLLTLSGTQLMSRGRSDSPGAIVLPQSFLYGGVKSVLFSLWRINSISTSEFMAKFYWELKYKRQTNAQALQAAKIASMKDDFVFYGTKISRAQPYFWAPYLLIGHPKIRSPYNTRIPIWGVIVLVYTVVIVVVLTITRKTLPNRKRSKKSDS